MKPTKPPRRPVDASAMDASAGDPPRSAAPPAIELTSEAYLASIVQSSDDAIVSKTLDGIITSWNPAATAMFGYLPEEAIGKPMTIIFPPDRLDEETFILERIVAGERVEHFETVRLRKDGTLIDVAVSISPVRNRHGEIVGAAKIARDVSAEKAATERMRLAAAVFTHASEAIIIADPDGRIIDANAAFTRITGYALSDVVGRGPEMFKSGRQGPESYMRLRRELADHGYCQGEIWSRRKDGETFAGLLTVSAVLDDGGEVKNFVAIFADITMLKQHQELLDRLAHHDPLTALPNRLLLADRINQAVAGSRRTARPFAVLYLDLDGFKTVNDHYGHDVGDELLISIAMRMKSHVRDVDTLARIGGDEFVILFVDVASAQACELLVERVLEACRERIRVREYFFQISCSIGYTIFPEDDADTDQLLRHADHALYEAKQRGRNRGHRFDATQDAVSRSREANIVRLAQALRNDEFTMFYQPKVNMRTGQVVGVEALAHWRHPELGLLSPAAFLPTMRGHELIFDLDRWAIGSALRQMVAWRQVGIELVISVNVSGEGLQRASFPSLLARALAEHADAAPHLLEIEIVESSALEDLGAAIEVISECRRLGVKFAVDDFGTGYSSLTYLRRLPAETLKIDQSFVRDMLSDKDDFAIVQGVIGLASAFKRTVIAEGVETVEHGARLLAMGCELAQGYGIARPMSADDFVNWLHVWRNGTPWHAFRADSAVA